MNKSAEPASGRCRVAIIGGGISGLATAQRFVWQSDSVDVTVFEASRRLGGIIRTESADDFLMELGPDSFITNKPAAVQLCEQIGFTDQLIPTDSRYRRSLVLRKGRPVPVPDGFMLMAPASPWAILKTPVLSSSGKLRLLAEAFVSSRTTDEDESLASFVRRRFGQQALERLIQPLIGGIYTSDPEKLSLRATLPQFIEMEKIHGSVIRATLAQQKAAKTRMSAFERGSGARYGLFATAAKGLGDLVSSLENFLKKQGRVAIQTGNAVAEVIPPKQQDALWQVRTTSSMSAEQFDAVIITLPAWSTAGLLKQPAFSNLGVLLNQIEYASSTIVVSGHRLADFSHPLDAFGLVVPAIEQRRILAVSFTSRKFPHRAPEGHILLRTFVGGAMQPELMALDDDAMVALVNAELSSILGMSAEPLFSEAVRYSRAMPQYHVGHLDRVGEIEKVLSAFPTLQLAGNAFRGVGIPDSIASGWNAADRILQHLNSKRSP